jgi:hypothetical protein
MYAIKVHGFNSLGEYGEVLNEPNAVGSFTVATLILESNEDPFTASSAQRQMIAGATPGGPLVRSPKGPCQPQSWDERAQATHPYGHAAPVAIVDSASVNGVLASFFGAVANQIQVHPFQGQRNCVK